MPDRITGTTVTSLMAFLLALLALFFTLFGAPGEDAEDALYEVLREARIRACYVPYPPSVIKEPEADEPRGVFPDALRHIASEIDVEVDWKESSWAGFIGAVQGGQCDVAIGAFYETISRAPSVAYTRPLYFLGSAAIVRSDSEIRTLEDLNEPDLRITVPQGTGEQDFAEEHLQEAEIAVMPGSDLNLPLMEVVNGRADASLSDTATISNFVRNRDNVRPLFLEEPLKLTAVAWVVHPSNSQLLRFLNSSIQFLETSGRLGQIEKQYNADFLHRETRFSSN